MTHHKPLAEAQLLTATKRLWSRLLRRDIADEEARQVFDLTAATLQYCWMKRLDEKFSWDLRDVSEGGDVEWDKKR